MYWSFHIDEDELEYFLYCYNYNYSLLHFTKTLQQSVCVEIFWNVWFVKVMWQRNRAFDCLKTIYEMHSKEQRRVKFYCFVNIWCCSFLFHSTWNLVCNGLRAQDFTSLHHPVHLSEIGRRIQVKKKIRYISTNRRSLPNKGSYLLFIPSVSKSNSTIYSYEYMN